MKIFSIVGWSGSGKTLLITRLIGHFKARGRRVIAVKSTHAGYGVQPDGKDTARFLQAGAEEAYLLAGKELLRMTCLAGPDELLAELGSRLGQDDIVLMEGLTRPGIPIIEVESPQDGKALKTGPGELAARVGISGGAAGRPRFHPDRITDIAAFMEEHHEH